MELRDEIDKLTETLKQQRDELKLKLHLGKMGAEEEWEKAEQKWEHFRAKTQELETATKDASRDVGAALKLLGEELTHAYDRVRKRL